MRRKASNKVDLNQQESEQIDPNEQSKYSLASGIEILEGKKPQPTYMQKAAKQI